VQGGRAAEAERLLQRELAINEKALGFDHPRAKTAPDHFSSLALAARQRSTPLHARSWRLLWRQGGFGSLGEIIVSIAGLRSTQICVGLPLAAITDRLARSGFRQCARPLAHGHSEGP
jgi:hypothetical protein